MTFGVSNRSARARVPWRGSAACPTRWTDNPTVETWFVRLDHHGQPSVPAHIVREKQAPISSRPWASTLSAGEKERFEEVLVPQLWHWPIVCCWIVPKYSKFRKNQHGHEHGRLSPQHRAKSEEGRRQTSRIVAVRFVVKLCVGARNFRGIAGDNALRDGGSGATSRS